LFVILLTGLPLKGLALSPIIIPDGSFEQTITQYTFFYEDTDSELTFSDIVTPEIQLRFAPTHSDVLKRGATQANLWVRLSLHNPLSTPLDTVLTLSNERLDSVRLFDITDLGSPVEVTGPSLDGSLSQAHAFDLDIGAKEIRSYLVRIETDALVDTLLELKSIDRFNAQEQLTDIMTGATMGLAFLVLVYFIYIKARGEDGIVTAGIVCTFAVFLFIPATAGIGSGLPFGADLPHGMVETLSACAILIAQLYAVLQLKWRQFWIRMSLYSLISVQLLIAMTDLLIPSYQTEVLVYCSAALNQLFIIFVPGFFRSQKPDAHPYLRSGAALVITGILATAMHSINLIQMHSTEQLLVFLLPLSIAASVFFAQMSLSLTDERSERKNSTGIAPATMGQISHELRTPINGVIGMSELLSETPLSASQRDYLETISMAGNDLLVLVNELSDLGKLKGREVILDNKAVRVANLLSKTLGHFQQEAIRKQVELILDLEENFPERLMCDRNRLLSVLYNLLSRTLAYTEHGALTLSASYYQGEQTQGLRLQLQISGTVVKQDELESILRLLQPGNTKVDSNDPRTWNFTVVRGLIRHMRGTLDIESLSSQGGSVTLFLPMRPDEESANNNIKPDTSLTGLRILIVDDNASLRSVIEKQLKRWGIATDSTYSGKEALAMLRTEHRAGTPYDMVIVDHDMPVMSGLQLAERIRTDEEIPRKPASLMLTGLSTNSVERSASAAGIDYVIAKPASGNRLREALIILQKRRSSY